MKNALRPTTSSFSGQFNPYLPGSKRAKAFAAGFEAAKKIGEEALIAFVASHLNGLAMARKSTSHRAGDTFVHYTYTKGDRTLRDKVAITGEVEIFRIRATAEQRLGHLRDFTITKIVVY